MNIPRTKVIAILDTHKIVYRVLPHSEPVFTVEAAAKQRAVAKQEIVKSILLCDKDGRYVMACVTGNARLDLKMVRAHLHKGWKRLHFATSEEVLAIKAVFKGQLHQLDCVPIYL